MGSNGWKHQKQLHDATRDGYNHLSTKTKGADNSLVQELVVDLILIGIGISVYIHLDVKPFLPLRLPAVVQSGSFGPILAMVGLALAGIGGIRMLFALLEAGTWLVAKWFPKKKRNS